MSFKRLSALVVLVTAVILSYYFINSSQEPSLLSVPKLNSSSEKEPSPLIKLEPKDNFLKTPLMEQLPIFNQESKNQSLGEVKKIDDSQNLTKNLASVLAQELIKKNESGPETIDGKRQLNVLKGDELSQLFDQTFKNADLSNFVPEVNDQELTIVNDNSNETIMNYLNQSENIIKEFYNLSNQEEVVIGNEPTSKEFSDSLSQLINSYNSIINQFYKIPVPSFLKENYKKQIQLVLTKKTLWGFLLNFNEDPLRAVSALQSMENRDFDLEFHWLKSEELTQIIKERNFKPLL